MATRKEGPREQRDGRPLAETERSHTSPRSEPLGVEQVRAAISLLVQVAAAFEIRGQVAEDDEATRLLRTVVELVERHDEATRERELQEDAAAIVPLVARIYRLVQRGRIAETGERYEALLVEAFQMRSRSLSSKQLEHLKLSRDQIKGGKIGGAKEAARVAVGAVLGPSRGTIINAENREAPAAFRFTRRRAGFGASVGDLGVVRYVLRAIGWTARGPEHDAAMAGWMPGEVRALLVLLGARPADVEEALVRRQAARSPIRPMEPIDTISAAAFYGDESLASSGTENPAQPKTAG